ncbi:hypothetical protein P4S64_07180 [Vibrio sp. M60_M31a]
MLAIGVGAGLGLSGTLVQGVIRKSARITRFNGDKCRRRISSNDLVGRCFRKPRHTTYP